MSRVTDLYQAALQADDAYAAACRAAYGLKAYPESRYYPRHTDAAVQLAQQQKHAADSALRDAVRTGDAS